MRLDDSYRLLDLPPGASDEEVKRAHRDLTKVWHPDRFAHDPALRERAEEKLKEIHAAYEAIRAARAGGGDEEAGESPWQETPEPPGRRPATAAELARQRVRKEKARAIVSAAVAVFLLLRRPTPLGLALALVLLGLSGLFVVRMRRAEREAAAPG